MLNAILYLAYISLFSAKNKVYTTDTPNQCSLLDPKYAINYNDYYAIVNFNQFDELSFNCSFRTEGEDISLVPNNFIKLDSKLDIAGIYELLYTTMNNVYVAKLNGIDISSSVINYKKNETFIGFNWLIIQYSVLNFFYNDRLIDTESSCNSSVYMNTENLFNSVKFLMLFKNIKYASRICPYLFRNSKIIDMTIYDLANTYIYKNEIKFIDMNETDELGNFNLQYLNIEFNYINLTHSILNRHVFKHLNYPIFLGVISDIQEDLFGYFKEIKCLRLQLSNLREVFHKGNAWMKHLNKHIRVDLNNKTDVSTNLIGALILRLQYNRVSSSFDQIYAYPDQDFCLFQHFPHHHLVYPMIMPGEEIECTCTLVWLLKYSELYHGINFYIHYAYSDENQYSYLKTNIKNLKLTMKYCFNSSFKHTIQKCNFNERLKNCNLTETSSARFYNKFPFEINTDKDLFYLIKWLQLIIFMFVFPILCLFGLFTNLLTILVIRNRYFKDSMYKHILINAVFNLIYCSLMVFDLMSSCIFYLSPFCSLIYHNKSVQYFKIVGIYFLGNIVKFCCNFSYISFSLSRFVLVSSKIKGHLKKIEAIKLIKFYPVLVVFSAVLSIFKLFQYKVNFGFYGNQNFPYEIRDFNYCEKYKSCDFMNSLNIINNIINDVLFIIVNIVIDLFLLVHLKAKLMHKEKLFKLDKTHLEAIKSKNNATRMIIINGLLFFISHFPEFITTVFLIAFKDKFFNFCKFEVSCQSIHELSQAFAIISISFQFFIYKRFNKKFRESFLDLKKRLLFKFLKLIKMKAIKF